MREKKFIIEPRKIVFCQKFTKFANIDHRPLIRLNVSQSIYALEVVLKKDGVSIQLKFSTYIKNIVENKRQNILQKDVVVFFP